VRIDAKGNLKKNVHFKAYVGHRRGKQTARETIFYRLAAGNCEEETDTAQICFTT